MTAVYGSRSLKRRRRTNDELTAIDEAIIAAVQLNRPITLRGVFYRVVSAGAIEKTELLENAITRHIDSEQLRLTRVYEDGERAGLRALMAHHRNTSGDAPW